jgi:hypothetical protein
VTTAPAAMVVDFGSPWDAQIRHLVDKLRLPTERWDDIRHGAHDRAFVVAGAAKADLLADLHRAVIDSAQATKADDPTHRGGLAEFRKDFKDIVQRSGWTGWTGEGSAKGEAWRTRVIYQTNMATSYAAGRYRQLTDPAFLKLKPYWQYVHNDGVAHPREQHQAWNGFTALHTHPFFKTHFAPNGWGCRCEIRALARPGPDAKTTLPEGWDGIDPKTGAPPGIDKGWAYAPGAATDTSLRQMVQDKLIGYPPAIAKALAADVNRYIEAQASPAEFARQVLADDTLSHPAWLGFVESPKAVQSYITPDPTGWLITLPASTPRHVRNDHQFDGQGQRPAEPEDYNLIASALNSADTLRAGHPLDSGHQTLVATKRIGLETFKAVFEVLPGKRNRALALLSLVIKTAGGG